MREQMSSIRKHYSDIFRLVLAVAAAATVLTLLFLPKVAFGVSLSHARSDSHAADYNLGSVVKTTAQLALTSGEEVKLTALTYSVSGRQAVPNIAITPAISGTQTLSASLPTDGTNPLGTLTATASSTDISKVFISYGYGYGYKGLSNVAKINYTVSYTPPINLFPAPASLPGPFNNSTKAFNIPGNSGSAASTQDFEKICKVQDTVVPGAYGQFAKDVLDIAQYDEYGDSIWVLKDGPGGLEDVIVETSLYGDGSSPCSEYGSFLAGGKNVQSIAWDTNLNILWTFGVTDGGQHYARVCDHAAWPVNCTATNGKQSFNIANVPNGTELRAATYDWVNQVAYVSQYQSSFTGMIKVLSFSINVSNALVQGNSKSFQAGPTGGGFNGLAKNVWNNPFPLFGVNSTTIGQFDVNSQMHMGNTPIQNVDSSAIPEVIGYDIMPDKNDMNNSGAAKTFLAADDVLYKSDGIIGAGVVMSSFARSITADGTKNNAFVLVSPNTIHYTKTVGGTAGASMGNFKTPGNSNDVDAMTHVKDGSNNYLYAVVNGASARVLHKAQIISGGGDTMVTMGNWSLVKTFGNNIASIGGMDASTSAIYMGTKDDQQIYTINFAGISTATIGLYNPMMGQPTPWGIEGLTFVPANQNPGGGDILIAARGFEWYRIDPTDGKVLNFDAGQPGKPPFNLIGITTKSNGHVMAVDKDTGEAFFAIIPGTPADETTSIGSYTASLDATVTNITDPSAEVASFNLIKASTLGLVITAVNTIDVSAVSNPTVGVTSGNVTITGTISDPTVSSVAVTADLTGSVLVGLPNGSGASAFTATADKAQYTPNQATASPSNYWHTTAAISGLPFVTSSNPVQYFGQNDTSNPNFCNPECNVPDFAQMPSVGALTSPSFTIGSDTVLSFKTYYESEGAVEYDRKMVMFKNTTTNAVTILGQIIDPYSMFFPGFNANNATPGSFKEAPFTQPGWPTNKFIMLPNSYENSGAPALVEVTIPMPSSLAGQPGKIMFKFDSIDAYGNDGKGWIVDDVMIVGSGTKVLAPGTVSSNLTWSIPLTGIADGTSTINVSASRSAYDPLTQSVQLTLIKDITAPIVGTILAKSVVGVEKTVISNNTTAVPSVELSGLCTEEVPKQLNVYLNGKSIKKITNFGTPIVCSYTANGTLSTASSGVNQIAIVLMDQAGLCNTTPVTACTAATSDDKLTLNLDVVAPVIVLGATSYPTGYTSARAGFEDMAVCQLDATDANGIDTVKGRTPGSATFDQNFTNGVPSAVKNQWGVTSNYVLPIVPPAGVFPGTLSIPIQVTDLAGNQSTSVCTISITAGLGGFVHNLMPGQNMISLPIIPTVANTTTLESPITSMVSTVLGTDNAQAIETILYYDATAVGLSASDRWNIWTASSVDTDSLTTFRTGKGYLFQMRSAAFGTSAPLMAGLPASPSPIKFQYGGTFLLTGQSIPPSYVVEGSGGAWNLIGFHSESKMDVKVYLGALEAPQRIWASVLEYQNYISFPICQTCGNTEVVLGAYKRLVADSDMLLGRGYWMFALDDGQIVP